MPCISDYDTDPGWPSISRKKRKSTAGQKKQLDLVTRHLCTVMGSIGPDLVSQLPQEIQDWWDKHKEGDKKRLEKERIEADIKQLKARLKELK